MSETVQTPIAELEHIWNPLDIGPTRVKHRIMMTAQTILYSDDHILGDRHIAFYRERAMGGAALLITEQQAAHRLSKGSFYVGCTAWEKRAIPQYAKLADTVHAFGTKQFVQLFAAGVHDKGMMVFDIWHPLWGVSRTPSIVHREMPMEMEKHHILDIVKGYGESALNVKTAGLDGVEVHGAHSYLVGQFLSRAYNKRTDEYGGSVENRARVIVQIGEEIRRQVGDDITVGVRLSFDELMGDAGLTAAESEEIVDILAGTGFFDYFNISGGGYHTMHLAVPPMNVEEGVFRPFGERAKEIVGHRAKVFLVGRILDLRMADEVVRTGQADMVAMTRAQMADPFMVTKAREGREDEIVRCVGANVCLMRAFDQREVTCVMNPAVGRERQLGHGTLQHVNGGAKRVVVVGGGPAGLKVAGTAAQRGHHVHLVERAGELGGHLNLLKQLPTRTAWARAIENYAKPLEVHGVEVFLDTEATPELIAAQKPDVVVVATGSHWDTSGYSVHRPDRDGIPGADSPTVTDIATAARRALADPSSLGERVLIFDESNGFLPLGLAELLGDAGVKVEIATSHFFVGEDNLKTMDLPHVLPRLYAKGVTLTPQTMVDSIDGNDVTLQFVWGGAPRVERYDTVVLSQMRVPNEELYVALKGTGPDVRRAGDAVTPRQLYAVVYEGEVVGREI